MLDRKYPMNLHQIFIREVKKEPERNQENEKPNRIKLRRACVVSGKVSRIYKITVMKIDLKNNIYGSERERYTSGMMLVIRCNW